MKTSLSSSVLFSKRWTAILTVCLGTLEVSAQVNSWTSTTDGHWQDPQWSLGVLPGPGQTVLVDNGGIKTLTIDATTTQNFPQTLKMFSLTVMSPPGASNTLFLDNAGLATALAPRDLIISNATLAILNSAVRSSNIFSVSGTMNQDGASTVEAVGMDFGYLGPGTYNLSNGTVNVTGGLFLGGGYPALINQWGGTNTTSILHLGATGEYALHGGWFSTEIYNDGGVFRQDGGLFVKDPFGMHIGIYYLAGGVFSGSMQFPNGFGGGNAGVQQTGGTNFSSSLTLGNYDGNGSYALSNGVIVSSGTTVGTQGSFVQAGGTHIINGSLAIESGFGRSYSILFASYTMSGGFLSSTSVVIYGGLFSQTGGTNQIAGPLTIYPLGLGYDQFNVTGYVLSGGQLTVSNITLNSGYFRYPGGTLVQSGLITFAGGEWFANTGSQQLGPVMLSGPWDFHIPASINMPGGASVLQFAASSDQPWADGATLTIHNWTGSLSGGGSQQILFGNSSAGLNDAQVAEILFDKPAGLPTNSYPAKILASGEVVPDPTRPLPPTITSINAPGPHEVDLGWKGNSGNETGYEIERKAAADTNFSFVASVSGSITNFADTTAADNIFYTYRVRALGPGGYSGYSGGASVITPADTSLPSPWQHTDIGNVGAAGNATYNSGTFYVSGAGTYIYNTNDSFHFMYQPWTGDGEIVARVTGLQNTDPWAEAGVMFRASLDTGSPEAMVQVTSQHGVWFLSRSVSSNETSVVQGSNATVVHWLKLVRSGNLFTGYESDDGANWSQVSSATISMPTNLLVGLAVSSHTNGIVGTANFDNVMVGNGSGSPPILNPLIRLADGSMEITLQGESGRAYRIEASTDLLNWTPLTTQTNQGGVISFTDTDAATLPQRFYRAALVP